MPDEQNANEQNTGNSNDGGSPTSEADGGQQQATGSATAESTGFRYGADAPPELQGKTPAEAAQVYSQLRQGVQQYLQNQQAQQTQYQQSQNVIQQNQQRQQAQETELDPDELYNDPAKWQQGLMQNVNQTVQQQIQQAAQPILQSNIETAKRLSRQENRDVWEKWGGEVEQLVSQVQPAARANTALWDQAAKIVRSNHVEEIAQERAKTLATEMGASSTEGGQGGARYGRSEAEQTALDKVAESEYGARLLDEYGPRVVEENARKMGYTLEEYAEMCAQTDTVHSKGRPGERPETWKSTKAN